MSQWIERKTLSGKSVQVGDMTITPQSQVISLMTPYGGLVWNRPSAVLVEQNGRTTTHPIVDTTRIALIALAVITFLAVLRAWTTRGQ